MASSDYEIVTVPLPNFLVPRLRLFLSVDVVNSTALKQKAAPAGWLNPSDEHRTHAKTRHDAAEDWFLPIGTFYYELERSFFNHWRRLSAHAEKLGWPQGEPPELWKASGDELLYCKVLTDYRQAMVCVQALVAAVNEHRNSLRKHWRMLDLKAAGWLAGFPVNNAEIVVLSDTAEPAVSKTEGDAVLANFRLLEQIYSKNKKRQLKKRYFRDFIGPSMDTGFRIAALSTARKMVVSVDLALMLSFADLALSREDSNHGVEPLSFNYDGRLPLKGVIDGAPYPIFWLDTASHSSLFSLEDRIHGRKAAENKAAIKEFCETFLRDLGDRHMPFIEGSAEQFFKPRSDLHTSRLNAMAAYWQKELEKRRVQEISLRTDNAPNGECATEMNEEQVDQALTNIIAKAGSSSTVDGAGKN